MNQPSGRIRASQGASFSTSQPGQPAKSITSKKRVSSPGWYVRIRRDGSMLKTQASREPEWPMSARSDTSFWVASYNAPMTFQAVAGRPVQLSYRGRQHTKLEEQKPPSQAQLRDLTGEYFSEELDTRYIVALGDSGLVMRHRRHGTIRLTHQWKDDFSGSMWFTRSVEFQRDPRGRVTGFSVFIDERSRDIRFTKRSALPRG